MEFVRSIHFFYHIHLIITFISHGLSCAIMLQAPPPDKCSNRDLWLDLFGAIFVIISGIFTCGATVPALAIGFGVVCGEWTGLGGGTGG